MNMTVACFFSDASFPYIFIIISMMTSASHFSRRNEQSAPALLVSSVTDMRNLIIIIGHWIVHAYGIISLTGFKELWYLSLVPAPAMFYILTAQFTDPVKIHSDWQTYKVFVKLWNWHLPRTGGASSRINGMSVQPNTIEVLQAITPSESDEP